jgi:hypothetical protein
MKVEMETHSFSARYSITLCTRRDSSFSTLRRPLHLSLRSRLSLQSPSLPFPPPYPPPQPTTLTAPFIEQFTPDWLSRWTVSKATKQTPVGDSEVMSYVGKWSVEEPTVLKGIEGDEGLVMSE